MDCCGCLQPISEEGFITCSSEICVKVYHVACTNASNLLKEEVDIWICPDCRAKTRRTGDNTYTPLRPSDNVTLRKKTVSLANNNSIDNERPNLIESLITEIRCLRKDMADMESKFLDRFDSLTSKLSDYETRITSLEAHAKENVLLKAQVVELQDQLNKQSQASLRSEVEIIGLTETPNENPYHLVLTAAQKIGVDLSEKDLAYVSRAGPRFKEDAQNTQRHPRVLVAAFCRRNKRDEFLKQAKARRSINSKDIVSSGPEKKIFVNERLTAENRRLFRASRLWAAENGFKYCWIRNGAIYIRKHEGRDGSPPIQIRSTDDLYAASGKDK